MTCTFRVHSLASLEMLWAFKVEDFFYAVVFITFHLYYLINDWFGLFFWSGGGGGGGGGIQIDKYCLIIDVF